MSRWMIFHWDKYCQHGQQSYIYIWNITFTTEAAAQALVTCISASPGGREKHLV